MANPTIGIGLPVYQNAKFLAGTLDSILTQSYENFVVYLSEDQSDDDTAKICREYAAKDRRINYSQNEKNLGEIGNYKKVLALADTEYFMFARGHEVLPSNLLKDCLQVLENDTTVVLSFAKTIWIDEDNAPLEDKHLSYFDTRGLDVISRCALVFWGKYEYFYGLTRTETMQSIRALEPVVATDLIMLFEMALRGSFAHINSGERHRRYYYNNESYKERIKRYQKILFTKLSFIDKYFPFAKVPFILFKCVAESPYSFLEKTQLILLILFNAPIKFFSARGKTL